MKRRRFLNYHFIAANFQSIEYQANVIRPYSGRNHNELS